MATIILRTLSQWLALYSIDRIDPDGFYRDAADFYERVYTKRQFRDGLLRSTLYTKHSFDVLTMLGKELAEEVV